MARCSVGRCSAAGTSLVELMVSLAIGSALIAGAVSMYAHGRNTYRVAESVARLQEQGRYALAVIEPDIELAGYFGFTNAGETIRFVRDGDPARVIAGAAGMRQDPVREGDPPPAALAALPASAHACGANFALDVLRPVQGSNEAFALGRAASSACRPVGGAQPRTDTLTIRRVATRSAAPEPGRLQIHASRLTSRTAHYLFADGLAPGPLDEHNAVHDLLVRAYYVSRDSVDRPGLPALRVKSLTRVAGAPAFIDDEVMPGIEDLQVQLGIDTGDYDGDGRIDPGVDADGDGVPETDGRATRYVDPDFPGLAQAQVVAVRLWIRVRAEEPEPGLRDARTYRYASVEYTPVGAERAFRRLVLSRTVALRNARTL